MYIKTIQEFIRDMECDPQRAVFDVLNSIGGVHSEGEKVSWRDSLPTLEKIFQDLPVDIRENCEIVLEANFIIEDKRADVVLVGSHNGEKKMIIIENKRWAKLSMYQPRGESSLWDPYYHQMVDHPSRQALHYKKALEYTNKYVQDEHIKIDAMVFMQNGTLKEKASGKGPFASKYENWYSEVPIFVGAERHRILSFITDRISSGIPGTAQKVYGSQVYYSEKYRQLLGNLSKSNSKIKEILDEYQSTLFDEIYCAVHEEKEKKVFLIEGAAGTGKTFVAIALLSYLYKNKGLPQISVRYLAKNRDLRKTLQNEMNVPSLAILPPMKVKRNSYDCLICDESHRIGEYVFPGKDERDFLGCCLNQSRVSVFFYSEHQRVHIDDYVTKERIKEAARQKGIPAENVIERKLAYQYRCQAAGHFLGMIDHLLYHSEDSPNNAGWFQQDEPYQVALVDSPEQLFQIIREKNDMRGDNHSSRVLSGKGSSFGEDWKWIYENADYEKCKTIAPLRTSNKKLYTWNFGNYGPNATFASDEKSVNLVGCIDTSQGLDFEYVGVIIAPDLIFNPKTQKIEVCISGHQMSDLNTGKQKIVTHDPREIEQIIKNTYWVLLSRGKRGALSIAVTRLCKSIYRRSLHLKRMFRQIAAPLKSGGQVLYKGACYEIWLKYSLCATAIYAAVQWPNL